MSDTSGTNMQTGIDAGALPCTAAPGQWPTSGLLRRCCSPLQPPAHCFAPLCLPAATKEMKACRQCMEASKAGTENRIVLITDAQPNEGDTTEEGLLARLKANAADGVHTTIIGQCGGGLGGLAASCLLLPGC